MNITVVAHDEKDGTLPVTLTISAADVDKVVKQVYRDVANRYNFEGFRRGRTPRPVIDARVGREAILADATNNLVTEAEPLMVSELDVEPVGEIDYGETVEPAVEHADYVLEATIALPPVAELTAYGPLAIDMPPEEATEAEIDARVDQMLSYQAHFHEPKDRGVIEGDYVTVSIDDLGGAEDIAGPAQIVVVGEGKLPATVEDALIGQGLGETREVTYATDDGEAKVSMTVDGIRELHTPELTDEVARDDFGFDTVEAFRAGIADEITEEKKSRLPDLKENRVLDALVGRLVLEEVPSAYVDELNRELINEVNRNLQTQGLTLELYLRARGLTPQQFMAEMRQSAEMRARQNIALEAYARHEGITVADDEVREAAARAIESVSGENAPTVDEVMEQLRADGRLPHFRVSARNDKILDALTDAAEVTIVDEVAKAAEAEAAEESAGAPEVEEAEVEEASED